MRLTKQEEYMNYKDLKVTFKMNFALDEAQASIRAARFAPELTATERNKS